MNNVVSIKGTREAPKSERSNMETVIISINEVNQWRIPPFQRPVRVNEKVRDIAEDMRRNGCEITGILTLGKVGKDSTTTWVVDGQHRLEGFRISGMPEILADVRVCHFDSMADMADEFVRLNTALVRMRPDDILRGLEPTHEVLRILRKECEFIGYDNVRRASTLSPVLGMSAVLRCWLASAAETPSSNSTGSAAQTAAALDRDAAQKLIVFLTTAHAAWGRDPENFRLWGNLNLSLCMWLWRRLVLDRDRTTKRITVLNVAQFKQCLMSLSANPNYSDWLQGRSLNDRDRSPCYARIKSIFARRLMDGSADTKKPLLPQPAWASK